MQIFFASQRESLWVCARGNEAVIGRTRALASRAGVAGELNSGGWGLFGQSPQRFKSVETLVSGLV